ASWRVVGEDEHGSAPSAAVYALDTVETLRCDVVPPPSCADGPCRLHALFRNRTLFDANVLNSATVVAPLRHYPVHRVVRTGDEAVEGHRYVPDHVSHECRPPSRRRRSEGNRRDGADMLQLEIVRT